MEFCQRLAILLALIICLDGCTATQLKDQLPHITNTELNDGVVILSVFDHNNDNIDDAEDCIRPSMHDVNPKLHILSAKLFHESLYPYFMPSVRPNSQNEYEKLLARPLVMKRIAELGVRYIVLLEKLTKQDTHNNIFCGGGPGGAGCLGAAWWDRATNINAVVWDLRTKKIKGSIQNEARGTGVMPAILLPIPLYMPATESAACKQVGTELGKALGGIK